MTTVSAVAEPDYRLALIRVDCLRPKNNPRTVFDQEALERLAGSIKAQGVLEPLLVVPVDETNQLYDIIAGERRWRSAQMAGLERVPCVVEKDLDGNDADQAIAALAENMHREDLPALDMVNGLQRLATEFKLTQRQIAERVGISQTQVNRILGVAKLPEKAQLWVQEGQLGLEDAARLWALPAGDRTGILEEEAFDRRQLDMAERQAQEEKAVKAEIDELRKGDVTVYETWEEVDAVNDLMPLSTLHWVKAAAHKNEPCRAVCVDNGRISELCSDPKAHPRPKAPRRQKDGGPELEETRRLAAELDQANERRRLWLREVKLPKATQVVGIVVRLMLAADDWLEILPKDLIERLGIKPERGKGTTALRDWVGDDEKRQLRALFVAMASPFEQRFDDAETGLSWNDKRFGVTKSDSESANAYMAELEALGYQPSEVEREYLGPPKTRASKVPPAKKAAKAVKRAPAKKTAKAAKAAKLTSANGTGGALPRGHCSECGTECALRKGGLVREHRAPNGQSVCEGAGQPAATGADAPTPSSTAAETAPDRTEAGEDDGPACRSCGCTEDNACEGGCAWIPAELDPEGGPLCSACAEKLGIPMPLTEREERAMETQGEIDEIRNERDGQAPDDASDEELMRVEPKGKKWAAICREHGEVGENTTQDYAQMRCKEHVQEHHAEADDAGDELVVKVTYDRDSSGRPHGVNCSEHGFITSQPTPATAMLRATGHLRTQHGGVGQVVEVNGADEASPTSTNGNGRKPPEPEQGDWVEVAVEREGETCATRCSEHGELAAGVDEDEAHDVAKKHVDGPHGGQAVVVEKVAMAS